MTEQLNFIIFRTLFLFEVHINTYDIRSVIRRKKAEHFEIFKKSIITAQSANICCYKKY